MIQFLTFNVKLVRFFILADLLKIFQKLMNFLPYQGQFVVFLQLERIVFYYGLLFIFVLCIYYKLQIFIFKSDTN